MHPEMYLNHIDLDSSGRAQSLLGVRYAYANLKLNLVVNLNQNPTKYIPGTNKTMATKGSKTIPITGSTDKCTITATSIVTLDRKSLPPI